MSHENAMAFRQKVGQDPALQKEARSILENGRSAQFVQLGKQHGFEFTSEDVKHVLGEIASKKVELTDFELEAISGGGVIISSGDPGTNPGGQAGTFQEQPNPDDYGAYGQLSGQGT